MRTRQWATGSVAAIVLAAVVVSCGGTGGGGGSKGSTGGQFILNSNNSGRLILNVNPGEVDANKSDRIGMVAVLSDSLGKGVSGIPITFSSDIDDITFIPASGTAFTDASGRADIIAVAGSQPSSTGAIIGTGAIFATAPSAFALRAQVQVTLFDVGFINADALGVIPEQIDLANPAFGTVLLFTVVGGTPPYTLSNPSSGIGVGAFGQTCLPGCTENGGAVCIGSPCQTDGDCNINGSSTPAGVCQGAIKHCLASCAGNNCAGAPCGTDSDCNNGSPTPANVCKDSGQSLAYTVTAGCGNGSAENTATDGATHKFQVFDSAAGVADITVVVSVSEQCDGSDFAGETCVSQGFQGGTLTCSAGCSLVTSSCTNTIATPGAGATFTPGGGVLTPTPTPTAGGAGTPTPAGTPGVGVPSNLSLALLTNGSGDNGNGTLTTVIAATVTDSNGNPVPNGTQVLFSLAAPTTGAVISSPSGTNQDPPCDVTNFQTDTGVTVLNQPGVAHACITYPTLQAGTGRTITAVSGAASDSQAASLP